MNKHPIKLTDEQIATVMDLGSKNLDPATIPEGIVASLFGLGIVSFRPGGAVYFTDAGEKIHDALVRQAA